MSSKKNLKCFLLTKICDFTRFNHLNAFLDFSVSLLECISNLHLVSEMGWTCTAM